MRPIHILTYALDRAGFEVHRHRARRRVTLMQHHGVDLVLDVGANTGGYASEMRRFGYPGAIASFEPLSDVYRVLSRRAKHDTQWSTHPFALGDANSRSTINVAANSASSSLLPMLKRHHEAGPTAAYIGSQPVEVRTLDSMPELIAAARRPFLKIDVQGFEGKVLDGSAASMPKVCGVQLELSFVPLYEGGMLVDEAFERMREAGFTLMRVEPGFTDTRTGQMLQADGVFFRDSAYANSAHDRLATTAVGPAA